jgi:hypothetical protein
MIGRVFPHQLVGHPSQHVKFITGYPPLCVAAAGDAV